MKKNNHNQKTSLATQAYKIIQEKIITMVYEPGKHLDEKQLVSELDIGRTPIREALLRLSSEFLVETQPNRGFVVRALTLQNIKAMFEALHILEMGAAYLCVQLNISSFISRMSEAQKKVDSAIKKNDILGLVWANDEFHMHFARACSNDYLIKSLRDVRYEVNRLAYLSFGGKTELVGDLLEHYRSVCREHEQIMDYLNQKDLSGLKKTIETHIHSFQHRMIIYLTSSIT